MKREDVFLIEQDSAEPLAWAVSGLRPRTPVPVFSASQPCADGAALNGGSEG
jgi:hypothetical protein